jgi:hypothetical protein
MRQNILALQPAPGRAFLSLQQGRYLLDLHLAELGFVRHPEQLDTPGDGSCAIWAALVQLAEHREGRALPDRWAHLGRGMPVTPQAIDNWRRSIVGQLPGAIRSKHLEWPWPHPYQEWMEQMRKPGFYVDQVFLSLLGLYCKRDIVLVPCFPQSGWGSSFRRILGGPGQTAAPGIPILMGYHEDEYFVSCHFQVAPLVLSVV